MTFDDWWESIDYMTSEACARAAWDYQQSRIERLEAKLAELEAQPSAKVTDEQLKVLAKAYLNRGGRVDVLKASARILGYRDLAEYRMAAPERIGAALQQGVKE